MQTQTTNAPAKPGAAAVRSQAEEPRRGVARTLHLRAAEVEDKGVTAEGQPAAEFVIATADVARDNHTIAVEGWELQNYLANPVVLFNHGSWGVEGVPVGLSERVWADEKLRAAAVFHPRDLNPFGHMIGEMVRKRFLRGASVRWDPLEWTHNEKRGGIDFKRQELLEWSVVTIPSDTGALEGARAAGLDVAPMREWAERVLDGELRTRGLVAIPRGEAEKLWGACGERRLLVDVKAAPTRAAEEPVPPAPEDEEPDGDEVPEEERADDACACGATPVEDAKFCHVCGAELERAEEADPAAEDEASEVDEEEEPDGDEPRSVPDDEFLVLGEADEDELLELGFEQGPEDELVELDPNDLRAAIRELAQELRQDVTGRIAPR